MLLKTAYDFEQVAGVGMQDGPNMRMRLLGGMFLSEPSSSNPVVALMQSRTTSLPISTSPASRHSTPAFSNPSRKPGRAQRGPAQSP